MAKSKPKTVKIPAQLRWAVVMLDTGALCHNMHGQMAIYSHRKDAIDDCPYYARVARVRITEVSEK